MGDIVKAIMARVAILFAMYCVFSLCHGVSNFFDRKKKEAEKARVVKAIEENITALVAEIEAVKPEYYNSDFFTQREIKKNLSQKYSQQAKVVDNAIVTQVYLQGVKSLLDAAFID